MPGSRVEVRDAVIGYRIAQSGTWLQVTTALALDVAAGDVMTLLGPSGCGKTSLLNAIAGLVPLSEGEIWIDRDRVLGPGPDRAMVFQDYALFPWRTVRENVEFGLRLAVRRADAGDVGARVDEVLELVGLTDFATRFPHQLSGGQKQRVGIARALIVEPRILLMDEPFAAVDALTRETMQMELLRILQARATTVMFVTHSIDEAILLGDDVAVLSARPCSVKEIVRPPFARPRDPSEIRASREFAELRERLWRSLSTEKAVGVEQ
jgi:NitT/TauT family transport system ATP-binding protein